MRVKKIKISSIKVKEKFSYRDKLENISELAKSIKKTGLLAPVVINSNNELISGYRRIEAFKELGERSIPEVTQEFSEENRVLIEELASIDETVEIDSNGRK